MVKCIEPSYEIVSKIDTGLIKYLEKIARTCYKSEDLISEDNSSGIKLLKRIVKAGHLAMIEHFVITVKFMCCRGFSHEIVRHRLCSFAQQSTRYCNYSKDKFGNEIRVILPECFRNIHMYYIHNDITRKSNAVVLSEAGCTLKEQKQYLAWINSMAVCENEYMKMIKNGASPQIARGVLPIDVATEIVVTANLREWRHIFDLRCHETAHPSMRQLMIPLAKELGSKIPIIFDDIRIESNEAYHVVINSSKMKDYAGQD